MQKKLRIFLVEDEAIIRDDIAHLIAEAGYDVVGDVSCGEDALRELQAVDADLVLMDIVLNGTMSGIDTAEAINLSMDLPVIFLTSYSDDVTRFQAEAVNPAGFLVKPFNIYDLDEVVKNLHNEGAAGNN